MRAVIYLIPGLLALGGFWLGVKLNERRNGKVALTARERKELAGLQDMRDKLLTAALDRVEVDPFAVEVIDQIRTTNRSITQ